MAEIITVYGERKPLNPAPGHKSLSTEQLQEAIGGNMEFTYPPNGKVMIVNEDGKNIGLLANIEATKIYLGSSNLDEFPGILNDPYRRINGDVVLCDNSELE